LNVQIFDDFKSLFHLFLGFITPILPHIGLAVAVIYFLYQSWERETLRSKRGDVIEFLVGAGGWALVNTILRVL